MTGQLTEWQLTRADGTVLVSFVLALGEQVIFYPPYGQEIRDPCISWYRALPDGDWTPERYYPAGYPGYSVPYPERQPEGRLPLVVVLDPVT